MTQDVTKWQVRLKTSTGDPADDSVNTYHVRFLQGVDSTKCATVAAAFEAFYAAIGPVIFGSDMATTGHVIKAYNLADPEKRQPIYTTTFGITVSGNAALPAELAMCLSFKGPVSSGEPPARHRGRVYLGPVHTLCNSGGYVDSGKITSVVEAAHTLLVGIEAVDKETGPPVVINTNLGIFSKPDNAFRPLTNGWMDNAWDVQRRRGWKATARQTFHD